MSKLHNACKRGLKKVISLLSNEHDVNACNTDGDSPLHIACEYGHLEFVKVLLKDKKSEINVQNSFGNTPLHVACNSKSLAIIRLLLEMRCSTNTSNKKGETAQDIPLNEDGDCLLHIACQWGDVGIVKYLITDQRCDLNVQSYTSENTPLHIAAKYGQEGTILQLLSCEECDPNVQNKNGDTPLHSAASSNKTAPIIQQLAHQQCNISVQNKDGDTPLHVACYKRSLDAVKLLLKLRCSTNIPNKKGETAQDIPLNKDGDCLLHIACQWGDVDIVRYLITDEKCNPSVQSSTSKNTPLHIAIKWSETVAISILLAHPQCNINVQNKVGDTPLHIATKYGQDNTIFQLLSCKGCNPNIQDKEGDTALHIAVRENTTTAISQLLTNEQCNLNAQNEDGDTPLHIAVSCEQNNIIIPQLLSCRECGLNVLNKEGDAPLHIAVRQNKTAAISKLLAHQQCNLNVLNKEGDSPLHIACYRKLIDIIKLLLKRRCSTNIPNKKGETAQDIPLNENGDCLLHIACQWGDVDIVRYLITDERCNPNVESFTTEHTPLHIAAKYGQDDTIIVQQLSCKECNLCVLNKEGDTPLHITCYRRSLNIIKLFLEMNCSTNIPNKKGETAQDIPLNEDGDRLLHIACRWGDVDIVKYLISDEGCNYNVQSSSSENTPLHIATKYGQDGTIVQLLSCENCNPAVQNREGDTPLHIAVRENRTPSVSQLLSREQCDPNIQNKEGDTPFHIAVRKNNKAAISRLLTNEQCDPNVVNNDHLTPLLIAIKDNKHAVATILLQHKYCDPTLCDSHGNTSLHLACIGGETQPEMVKVAKRLLTFVDPSCVNNAGQTPIELTTNYQLIQAISHMVQCKTKQSVQTYLNMFIVGNPETGKSSLVKAICKEATSVLWQIVPKLVRRVKNVPRHTAGIIPTTFRSKTFGNTVLYDLAGQVEYYSSHAAVIQSTVISTPPAFIVVVNLSEGEETISQTLRYWWSFIDNHAARSSSPPEVILVGSHADLVRGSVQEKMNRISALLRNLPASFHFGGQVALDCRDPASRELQHFCFLVNQSCTVLRKTADVDLRCHVLYAFLLDRFKDNVACKVSDVATCVRENRELLPQSPSNLIPLVSTLSDKGLLLLVKESESHGDWWIILQKQALLGEINGAIFAPRDFSQHKDLSQSTGVVPFSKLKNEFQDYDPNMVTEFLTHLEFCFKIKDNQILALLKGEASNMRNAIPADSEKYYFFPALVSVDNPSHMWEQNDDLCCKCGWLYQCIQPDQFLTTQFLHVLILRLAFAFALQQDQGDCLIESLFLRRKCSVWKHGIGWLNWVPIETVVEVGLQHQSVIVMMRCHKGKEAECVQLRSEVIQKVLEVKDEHCKAVEMSESFIHPTDVNYPFTHENVDNVKCYSLTGLARMIARRAVNALDQRGRNPIPVQDLLLFDPCNIDTSTELLRELFSEKHSMDEAVRSQVLENLNTSLHRVVIRDVESEASTLVCILKSPAQREVTFTTVPLQVPETNEKAERRKTVSSQHCTKPTLPELLKFTCTDERVLNITVEIANKYVQFGTILLDDRNGSRVKIMAHKHLNDAERINIEILQEWLTGRGKQPVTWALLVEVLYDIELTALAGEIEAVKCPAKTVSKDF